MANTSGHGGERKECIPGIECSVTNCAYNGEKRNCFADKINVGPVNAEHEDETKCATFKCKFPESSSHSSQAFL